jgi:hypothetical protein
MIWNSKRIKVGLRLGLAFCLVGLVCLPGDLPLKVRGAMKTSLQIVDYKGWRQSLQLSNGTVELVMPLEVGPRVMRYGYVGGPNHFKEYEEQLGRSGEAEWMIRGGHRIWHAPEDDVRTYVRDNGPIRYERLGETGVRLIQPVEVSTGIEKEIDLLLDPAGTGVTVRHRLRNRNLWEVELAPWALTVMAQGGIEIIPLPEKIAHPGSVAPGEPRDLRGFVANQSLILWPFTDLSDPRYRWGSRYITLRQDRQATTPTKLGLAHQLGWVAYLNHGQLFVKEVGYEAGRHYPDSGSNFETFTNRDMLEIETLGPRQRIAPGGVIEHVERWWLLNGISAETSDMAIDQHIRPKVEALRRSN